MPLKIFSLLSFVAKGSLQFKKIFSTLFVIKSLSNRYSIDQKLLLLNDQITLSYNRQAKKNYKIKSVQ